MRLAFGRRLAWVNGRSVRGAVLAGSAIAMITLGTALAIGGSGERGYEGALTADTAAMIRMSMSLDEGRGQRAVFEAQNVPVLCADETTARREFLPITAKFENTKSFEGRRYNPPSEAGARQLFKMRGRLMGGGRATGFLFYFDEDCSTDGLLRWTAERVR